MYFPNGQSYNVVLVIAGKKELVHEPWPVLPRKGEYFCHNGREFIVTNVKYSYRTGVKRRRYKPQITFYVQDAMNRVPTIPV